MAITYRWRGESFSCFPLPSLPKGNEMDYIEKLERLDKHIEANPKDYQAVIARLKTRSDAIDHVRKKRMDARLKRVAEIRRKRHEEHNE